MTVSGWILFAMFAAIIGVLGYAIYDSTESVLAILAARDTHITTALLKALQKSSNGGY